MTWFKVDDKLHSNSKIRKVLAEDPAALALWTVAGSWSSDNLTDGFVPDHQLPWLIPSGADELAQKLVAARLWRRVRGGHQFHEWEADADGTKRNPTRVEVESERRKKAEAGRKGGLASGKTRSKPEARASASATPSADAGAEALVEPPTRPDPTLMGGRSTSATHGPVRAEPPRQCREHEDDPDPPACGRCKSARQAHERWARDHASHLAGLAAGPRCESHQGQPAHNCSLCRAERLGAA
jgi:hypothetical protein